MKVYMVYEQWPHRIVATFATLKEAEEYLAKHRADLNIPIIVSGETEP